MKTRLITYTTLALCFFLSACQPGQILEPTHTPSPTATLTPTPTSTPTPTFTPSPTPTPRGGSDWLLIQQGWGFYDLKIHLYNMSNKKTKMLLDGFSISSVSQDGKKALVYKPKDENFSDSLADLYLVELDAPNPVLISEKFRISISGGWQWISAGWIPGTDTIVYRGGEDSVQLFKYDVDGITTQLTDSDVGVLVFFQELVDNGICWIEGTGYSGKGFHWTSIDSLETKNNPKCEDLYNQIISILRPESPDIGLLITNIPNYLDVKVNPNGPYYSPDGEKLIWWLDYCDYNGCYPDNTFYVVSKEGEVLNHVALSDGVVDKRGGSDLIGTLSGTSFSPDSKNLILQFQQSDKSYQNFLVNLDSGAKEILTFDIPEDTRISRFIWLP